MHHNSKKTSYISTIKQRRHLLLQKTHEKKLFKIQILKENRLKIPNTNSRKNLLEKYCFHQNLKSSRIDQNDDVPL